MGEWLSQRTWEEERGVAPAGGTMPAGESAVVPPPFLVYKHRLYVLARKAPVLDHRQASIDEIFGNGQRPGPKPIHQVRQGNSGTAVQRPAAWRKYPEVKPAAQAGRDPHPRPRPRFVPRKRLAQTV